MKKVIIIVVIVIGILFLSLLLIPVLFKDQIKAAVDDAISASVNAEVVWDADDFSLSLISHFPNATATLKELGVVNRAPFDGQVLFTVQKLQVEIDIFSLLGDQIKVKGIELDEPVVNLKIAADGSANYDIALADSSSTQVDTTASEYNIGIDHWEINDGRINYEDATMLMALSLKHVNHNGSGNLTEKIFDLDTHSIIDSASFSYDGIEYISDKRLEADVVLTISDDYGKYAFKENSFKINDLNIGLDGDIEMPDDEIRMDLTINALDNSFKSLLSLVPGMYTKDFNNLESEGKLDLEANVKGVMDSLHIPAFDLHLATKNAMFKYPDLPEAVRDIQLDLAISNKNGIMEDTRINLNKFHMQMGQNPVDMRLIVENLRDYPIDADLNATLNLGELTTFFPLEDMELRGQSQIKLTANGKYDSIKNIMPKLDADISLTNGYVKTGDLPYALDNLQIKSNLRNTTGQMKDFIANVSALSFVLDGSPFALNGTVSDLTNYTWNIDAKGKVDLEKVAGIMDLKDMKLAGLMNADIHTKGNMNSLEAEHYTDLPTSGNMSVTDFLYASQDLPYDVKISSARADFDPQKINLRELKGTAGKSDFNASGSLSHYIEYIFAENQTVQGDLNVSSNYLNLDEFMSSDESTPASADSISGVIQVPGNIDMTLNASLSKVDLMNMSLTDVKGKVLVKNQKVDLTDLIFNLLGGKFGVNGSYATLTDKAPTYSFGLDVNQVSIAKAFTTFEMVKKFAPIAKNLTGNISSNLNISGFLNDDMSPALNSVDAKGVFKIAEASLKNSPILESLSSVTGLTNLSNTDLKNLLMSFKITDGKLLVEPFDVKLGEYTANIGGATSLDGSLAYNIGMNIPAGKAGSKINSFLSQYTKNPNANSDMIPINIGLGGTYNDPKPVLLMDEQKELVENALKETAREEAKEGASKILDNVKDDQTKEILNNILGTGKKDTVKTDSLKKSPVQNDSLKEDATKIIKDLFKKKKKKDDQ